MNLPFTLKYARVGPVLKKTLAQKAFAQESSREISKTLQRFNHTQKMLEGVWKRCRFCTAYLCRGAFVVTGLRSSIGQTKVDLAVSFMLVNLEGRDKHTPKFGEAFA